MSVKISPKYNSVDKMRAGTKSVLSRAINWRKDVQLLGVATLDHAREHGNWTLARDLAEGLTTTNGVNKTACKRWMEHYMHAELTEVPNEKTGKTELKFLFDEGKGVKDIDVEGAASVNWFDYKAPPTDKSKNIDQVREALVKLFVASAKTAKIDVALAERVLEGFDTTVETYLNEQIQEELKAVA